MPEQDSPFAPRGAMSVLAACEQLIRETAEKDGFDYSLAVTEIRARTALDDLERDDLMGPMRLATDRLHAEGVPGVMNVKGVGWQRMTPGDMVTYIETRVRRGRRQYRRGGTAVQATDRERLEWQDRHRLDNIERRVKAVAGIEERRAKRLRPLPPGETA